MPTIQDEVTLNENNSSEKTEEVLENFNNETNDTPSQNENTQNNKENEVNSENETKANNEEDITNSENTTEENNKEDEANSENLTEENNNEALEDKNTENNETIDESEQENQEITENINESSNLKIGLRNGNGNIPQLVSSLIDFIHSDLSNIDCDDIVESINELLNTFRFLLIEISSYLEDIMENNDTIDECFKTNLEKYIKLVDALIEIINLVSISETSDEDTITNILTLLLNSSILLIQSLEIIQTMISYENICEPLKTKIIKTVNEEFSNKLVVLFKTVCEWKELLLCLIQKIDIPSDILSNILEKNEAPKEEIPANLIHNIENNIAHNNYNFDHSNPMGHHNCPSSSINPYSHKYFPRSKFNH